MRIVGPTDEQIRVGIAAAQRNLTEAQAAEEQSLLDRFAGQMAAAIVSNPIVRQGIFDACGVAGKDPLTHIAEFAYDHAEALMAERARRLA